MNVRTKIQMDQVTCPWFRLGSQLRGGAGQDPGLPNSCLGTVITVPNCSHKQKTKS